MKNTICNFSASALLLFFTSVLVNANDYPENGFIKTVSISSYSPEFSFQKVAIYGEKNDYKPADDEDVAESDMGEDLKNIISRVFKVDLNDGRQHGSGFVTGENCDKVTTSKHNTHDVDKSTNTVKRAHGKVNIVFKTKRYKVGSIPQEIAFFKTEDDLITYPLSPQLSGLSCPEIPIIKRRQLIELQKKEVLTKLSCKLIGFPNKSIYKTVNGKRIRFSTKFSGVPKKGGGEYSSSKRGMVDCNLLAVNDIGKLYHACDTLPGASGGPIVCKT